MSWPLSQDYNEAVQSADSSFSNPELRSGQAITNVLGMPMPRSGNFADVYEFVGGSGAKWAVKCFTRHVPGLRERYTEISATLLDAKLPFAVDFQYLAQGIRVRGDWFPILKMRWVDGYLLNEFVRDNLDKPALLGNLGLIWCRMAKRLREANIAHADLQHGNVILVPGIKASSLAVRLIDYDGMWVPALANKQSGEVGHPNYQHPQRLRDGSYSAEVDRFPLLVVATALRALVVGGRGLWERYDNGDNLLFREADLRHPAGSALLKELWNINDVVTHDLTGYLVIGMSSPITYVPLLQALMSEDRIHPLSTEQEKRVTAVLGPGAVVNRTSAITTVIGADLIKAPATRVHPGRATMVKPAGTSANPKFSEDFDEASSPETIPAEEASRRTLPVWALSGGAVAALAAIAVAVILLMTFLGGEKPAPIVQEMQPSNPDGNHPAGAKQGPAEATAAYRTALSDGQKALETKNYDAAIKAFQQAIELMPNDADARKQLKETKTSQDYQSKLKAGREALKVKDYDAAIKSFQLAIELMPNDVSALDLLKEAKTSQDYQSELKAGREALRMKDYDAAIKAFQQAIELMPNDAIALSLLKEAKTPQDFQSTLNDGQNALKVKNYDAAIKLFQQAVALRPADATALNLLKEAIASRDYQSILNDGQKALETMNYDVAIKSFEQAIKRKPNDAAALNLLKDAKTSQDYQSKINAGRKALNAKNYDAAIKSFRQAILLRPTEANALNLLKEATIAQDYQSFLDDGKKALKVKNYDAAIKAFQQAGERMPNDAIVLDLLKEAETARNTVVTTKSGLKYVEWRVGAGQEVKVGDTVTLHYTGALADGTKFDSTIDRKMPSSVLFGKEWTKGFKEGVLGMKEGGKRKLIVPPTLGYDAKGNKAKGIPPNAELHYEVELLKVKTIHTDELLKSDDLYGVQKTHHKVFPFVMEAGQTYQIDMESRAFNSYLFLEGPDRNLLTQDNDNGGFTDARIIWTATKTGKHRIIAAHVGNKLGEFKLTIQRK